MNLYLYNVPRTYNPVNSSIGTLTSIGGNSYYTNTISTTTVKTVLGVSDTNSIKTLCTHNNVNEYAYRVPGTRSININDELVYTDPSADYSLASFAGYNHNAVRPYISGLPTSMDFLETDNSLRFRMSVYVGEIKWSDINSSNTHVFVKADDQENDPAYGYAALSNITYSNGGRADLEVVLPKRNLSTYTVFFEFWFGQILVTPEEILATGIVKVPDSTSFARSVTVNRLATPPSGAPTSSVVNYIPQSTLNTSSSSVEVDEDYSMTATVTYNGQGSFFYTVVAVFDGQEEVIGGGTITNLEPESMGFSGTFSTFDIENGDHVFFELRRQQL